jgi:shikimate kinase
MMGSGKSVVGPLLAARLGIGFVDTDEEVAVRTGCSVAQLWGERGEAAFRALEASAVARIAGDVPSVVATGGGVVLDGANVDTMRMSGRVIWLQAEPATLAARVGEGAGRPLLLTEQGIDRLAPLLEQRRERYAAAADLAVATDERTPDDVADEIEAWWNES